MITESRLERDFTIGTRTRIAPDGKSEFLIASSKSNLNVADLFVSTTNGSTWQEVADSVGDGGPIDGTSMPASWSPYTVNGQDVLAVLSPNTSNVPDANGNTLPEKIDLYAVGPNGAQRVGETETEARSMQFNYGDKLGTQNMYSWQQQGNKVTFTIDEPVGGQNPDGTTWVGGMEAGSITAQIPPIK